MIIDFFFLIFADFVCRVLGGKQEHDDKQFK